MNRFPNTSPARLPRILWALAVSMLVAGAAVAAAPKIDERDLLAAGFKVLVAATPVQEEWVKSLPPGQIRPMQRNGKKFFIYPDAAKRQVYVGGPQENAAYEELHPNTDLSPQDAAMRASAYRSKRDQTMQNATARDLSDPFLGATWYDLGW
jgi:hypothetical protein